MVCCPEKQVPVSVKFGARILKYQLKQTEEIGELRKIFCQAENLELSLARLLFNGQRLEDSDIIETLLINGDDVIEAFL